MVVCIILAGDSLQFNSFFKKSENTNVYKLGFQATLHSPSFSKFNENRILLEANFWYICICRYIW